MICSRFFRNRIFKIHIRIHSIITIIERETAIDIELSVYRTLGILRNSIPNMELHVLNGITRNCLIESKANTAMCSDEPEGDWILILIPCYDRRLGVVQHRHRTTNFRHGCLETLYLTRCIINLGKLSPFSTCYCPKCVREGREVPVLDCLEFVVNRIISHILPVARIASRGFLVIPEHIVSEYKLIPLVLGVSAIDAEVTNILRKRRCLSGTSHLA